jgi:hypothetical protein
MTRRGARSNQITRVSASPNTHTHWHNQSLQALISPFGSIWTSITQVLSTQWPRQLAPGLSVDAVTPTWDLTHDIYRRTTHLIASTSIILCSTCDVTTSKHCYEVIWKVLLVQIHKEVVRFVYFVSQDFFLELLTMDEMQRRSQRRKNQKKCLSQISVEGGTMQSETHDSNRSRMMLTWLVGRRRLIREMHSSIENLKHLQLQMRPGPMLACVLLFLPRVRQWASSRAGS